MFFPGMTGESLHPSEGYVCRLFRRAAKELGNFKAGLKKIMLQRSVLYWDDTVVMIHKHRACMRFYGDEQISYYTAHEKKDLDSLIEDNVLNLLTAKTTVMHDHNTVNYNERFCFENIECIQHLERDLQKSADDNPGHTWTKKMKETVSLWIKKRKDYQGLGKGCFEDKEEEKFHAQIRRLIRKGYTESEKSTNPTTDNLAERGLRSIKSHMKISGQFENERSACDYATVKTYVETCRKNGINEMTALSRLCSGNPYTVDEIFA